jgi:carbamoyltransferase
MRYFSLHNGHDASVTAFEDGEIVMHFELERHFGVKHLAGVEFGNAVGDAITLLLSKLNWSLVDIKAILFCGLRDWGGNWTRTEFHQVTKDRVYSKEIDKPYLIWSSNWRGLPMTFVGITHHVNHMAYAYYTSPFEKSIIFAIDGKGDFGINCTYGTGCGSKLNYLGNTSWENPMKIAFANIGISYSLLGVLFPFLGLDPLACAGKAMGLSSYGQAVDDWRLLVKEVLFPNDIRDYIDEVDSLSWAATKKNIDKLKSSLDIDYGNPNCKSTQDLMATIQDEFERYMVLCVRKLSNNYDIQSICLSGGCALNCQVNSRILNEKAIEKLYVPPACSDSGLSIGAGLYYWHNILGNQFKGQENHIPYLGDLLLVNHKKNKRIFEKTLDKESLLDFVSSKISEGKIIAWAQGRSEIGPRALGNRSILCAPYPNEMKDKVNEKIKHREFWRPFAPVCLEECVSDWFEIDHAQPYMLECPSVKKDKKDLIPAVTHVDGTARVQTVNRRDNTLLYDLVKKFKDKTGVPVLMNTSLNDKNKPIANDSKSILDMLINTELDYVVINNSIYGKLTH